MCGYRALFQSMGKFDVGLRKNERDFGVVSVSVSVLVVDVDHDDYGDDYDGKGNSILVMKN